MNEIDPKTVPSNTMKIVKREKYLLPSENMTVGMKARTKG